jgi:hypothetical protein
MIMVVEILERMKFDCRVHLDGQSCIILTETAPCAAIRLVLVVHTQAIESYAYD